MNLSETSRDFNGHPHALTIASWDRSAYSSALPPDIRSAYSSALPPISKNNSLISYR